MLKREHLLDYMIQGYIHLSKKDYGFYNNLRFIIKDKKKITTNQNKLFEKLLVKYQRQLRKQGHQLETLLLLKWDIEIVDSAQEYLVPRIYVENDELRLRTPFNSKFIQALKREHDNTFIWDKEYKVYKSKFYTHSLRLASDLCYEFFDRVEFCEQLESLIAPLRLFDGMNFEPMLVFKSGNYYISNINENLYNATKHIELDGSAECLFQLSTYGIKIDDDITQSDPFLLFASKFDATIDLDDLISNIDYLKKLKVDGVIFSAFYHDNFIDKTIRNLLINEGIKVDIRESMEKGNIFYLRRSRTMVSPRLNFKELMNLSPDVLTKVSKIIDITNSRPIEVR